MELETDALMAGQRDNLLGLKEKYLTDVLRIGNTVKKHILTSFYNRYSLEHYYSEKVKDSPFVGDVTILVNAGCSLTDLKVFYAYGKALANQQKQDAKGLLEQIKSMRGKQKEGGYDKAKSRIIEQGKKDALSEEDALPPWMLNEVFRLVNDTNKYVGEFKEIEEIVDKYLQSDMFKEISPVSEFYGKISAIDERLLKLTDKQAA